MAGKRKGAKMVKITELPISKKMQEQFEQFYKITSTETFTFKEITSATILKVSPSMYPGVNPMCSVCGHGLETVLVFQSDQTGRLYGLGSVCGCNLIAMQKDGIDQLNFNRTVALEKKTIMKRMLEFQAEQNKIKLEVEHTDAIYWLYQLVEESKIRLEEVYEGFFYHWADHVRFFKKHLEFYHSLYIQVTKKGTLSDKQINALKKSIHIPVEEKLDKMERAWEVAREQWEQDRKVQSAVCDMDSLLMHWERNTYGSKQWDIDFIKNVREYYDKHKTLSDKQIAVIKKIYKKESKIKRW
jgi:hypothetical protein